MIVAAYSGRISSFTTEPSTEGGLQAFAAAPMRLVERTLDDTPAIAPVSSATSSESEKEKKKSGGGIKSFFGFKKKDKDKEEKDKFVGGLVLDRPGCDILQ